MEFNSKITRSDCRRYQISYKRGIEFVYSHFTENNSHKYLKEIQGWLHFIRQHKKNDPSLPVTDYTVKPCTDIVDWTLEDIDNLPTNAKKLQDLKQLYHKQHTGNTVPTTVPTSMVITPAATATESTPGPQSHSVPDTLASTINISKSNPSSSNNPPPPPPPPRKQTPILSPSLSRDSSPGEMPSIHDRAVFIPQATFDGKDKSKTRTRFEDFVARQRLDTTNEFNEIKEYFLMTLHDLARQWFSSTTFTSYEDMKTKFTQEFSEYGKTAREWLKAWTELHFQKFKELATLLA